VLGIFGKSDPARTRPWGGQYVGSSDGWPDLNTVQAALEPIIDSPQRKSRTLPMAA
jgi:hypothetical protein